MQLRLEIISPQEVFYDQDVDHVILPGIEGDFAILKNHMPFLTSLRIGIAYVYIGNKLRETFLVTGGIVEVSNNKCTLLTEEICKSSTITSGEKTEQDSTKTFNDTEEIKKLKEKALAKFYYS
tara:strand:- start:190 stop:558 length:369 start_codon:yes stop_codon:yes gene_type:complete